MRVLLQRVRSASVSVDGDPVSRIGPGLLVFVGVGPEDTDRHAQMLAEKTAHLRIFEDDQGKTNLSVLDVSGEALVVSQFTLYADTRKGRRPSFVRAAHPDLASPLVDVFAARMQALGVPTQQGSFGASMQVELVNDGPMTIWIEED